MAASPSGTPSSPQRCMRPSRQTGPTKGTTDATYQWHLTHVLVKFEFDVKFDVVASVSPEAFFMVIP